MARDARDLARARRRAPDRTADAGFIERRRRSVKSTSSTRIAARAGERSDIWTCDTPHVWRHRVEARRDATRRHATARSRIDAMARRRASARSRRVVGALACAFALCAVRPTIAEGVVDESGMVTWRHGPGAPIQSTRATSRERRGVEATHADALEKMSTAMTFTRAIARAALSAGARARGARETNSTTSAWRRTTVASGHRKIARSRVLAAAYGVDKRGEFPSLEFRCFVKDESNAVVSAWHGIPLKNADGTYNFLCEIPKETKAKMEVATDEKTTPIKQDVKKGKLRDYPYNINWNYGMLPQTWEDRARAPDDEGVGRQRSGGRRRDRLGGVSHGICDQGEARGYLRHD